MTEKSEEKTTEVQVKPTSEPTKNEVNVNTATEGNRLTGPDKRELIYRLMDHFKIKKETLSHILAKCKERSLQEAEFWTPKVVETGKEEFIRDAAIALASRYPNPWYEAESMWDARMEMKKAERQKEVDAKTTTIFERMYENEVQHLLLIHFSISNKLSVLY